MKKNLKKSVVSNYTPVFGEQLRTLRLNAGYQSLDAAIIQMRKLNGNKAKKTGKNYISKAMLNLLERGKVGAIRPELLRLLSDFYKVPYNLLCRTWINERYALGEVDAANNSITVELENSTIKISTAEDAATPTTIVPIDFLEEQQGLLPVGSKVAIAAIRFLDDNRFFKMVTANLLRGINYTYLMPELRRPRRP